MLQAKGNNNIVMYGGFGHEGIYTKTKSLGFSLINHRIDVSVKPATWVKRADEISYLVSKNKVKACIFYLHTTLFIKASQPGYREAFIKILNGAGSVKKILFIYQSDLNCEFASRVRSSSLSTGRFDPEFDFGLNDGNASKEQIENNAVLDDTLNVALLEAEGRKAEIAEFLAELYSHNISIAPFQSRSDVTVRLDEFFSDLDEGVILRLYIPHERYQAEQLGQLLAVMERYLRQVEGKSFSIDSRKTDNGVLFVFKSTELLFDTQDFNFAIDRFDTFMKLCGDNINEAVNFITMQGISKDDALNHVTKYSRDIKRFLIDCKHEFEKRMLQLRHEMENDLADNKAKLPSQSTTIPAQIEQDSCIVFNIENLSIIKSDMDCSYNENNYNKSDVKMIELFNRYADKVEALQCQSDLDLLKDKSSPESVRHNSSQRLKGFLGKAASKTAEIAERVAVSALSAYLDRLLKGQI